MSELELDLNFPGEHGFWVYVGCTFYLFIDRVHIRLWTVGVVFGHFSYMLYHLLMLLYLIDFDLL